MRIQPYVTASALLFSGLLAISPENSGEMCGQARAEKFEHHTTPLPSTLKVASYNVKSLTISASETFNNLREIDADVVLLQEVTGENIDCLRNEFPDYNFIFAPTVVDSDSSYGIAIMIRGEHDFADYSFELPVRADQERRKILVANIGEITIANTHLTNGDPETRRTQFQVIEKLNLCMGVDILGGDFNTEFSNPVLYRFANAIRLRLIGSGDSTFLDAGAIDHFFTAFDTPDFRVVKSPGSDHYPIIMDTTTGPPDVQ